MGLRSTAMLQTDFPVVTTAQLIASTQKFDYLVREGFLGDPFDFQSIVPWLGAAMSALAETFSAPTAAYTGTAGAVNRYYALVPNYPVEYGPGNGGAVAGKYLSFLGGKPPYGFPAATANSTAQTTADGVRRLYGPITNATEVTNTGATLGQTAYVTVTTPTARNIPGVLFDIVEGPSSAGPWTLVAVGVPAATAFQDTGTYAGLLLYGAAYTPRAYPEIGYDGWTATLGGGGSIVGASTLTVTGVAGSGEGPESGDSFTIDTGANQETLIVGSYAGGIITLQDDTPAKKAHAAGVALSNGGEVVYGSLTRLYTT